MTREERNAYLREWRNKNREKVHSYDVEYRKTHKEEVKKAQKKYRKKNGKRLSIINGEHNRKVHRRFTRLKSQAKERHLTVSLSIEQYEELITQPCYYCNYLYGIRVETGSGLDRLDSNIGYDADNVVSCCKECNELKMDNLTPEETKACVKLILTMRGIIK